jgi:hypothetical protein
MCFRDRESLRQGFLGRAQTSLPGNHFVSSIAGCSPFAHPKENIKEDGSVCSDLLGPGKYYLYFMSRPQDNEKRSVAEYYPGVNEQSAARAIEISASCPLHRLRFGKSIGMGR